MELTEKRIAANRRNAQKSTGPKSEHGKRISSLNGARHGILAKSVLVDNEDQDRFAEILNSLIIDFSPKNDSQRSLVERMAVAVWRTHRVWAVESAAIIHETRSQAHATGNDDPPTRIMLAMRKFSDDTHHPDLWGRYEARYDRAYYKALATLTRLQNNENAARTHLTPAATTKPEISEPTISPGEATIQPAEPILEDLEPTS